MSDIRTTPADRLTPREILGAGYLEALTSRGYVIVHPDDVPPWECSRGVIDDEAAGWNTLRDHIFPDAP